MPKSDSWPGGVAIESLSNMDSAGSFDSVISLNSGCSEDSMEHLSPEERACLMYLEETIEALEVQEDSGLSNDEPDFGHLDQKILNDISSLKSGEDEKALLSTAVPTPLAQLAVEPGSRALTTENKDEHLSLNPTSEPQSRTASAASMSDLKTLMNILIPASESVDGKNSSAPQVLCFSANDGNAKSGSANSGPLVPPEMDLGLIPPPSDFMDEPEAPPQPESTKSLPPSAESSSNKPVASLDLEELRQRACARMSSGNTPMTQEIASKPPYEVPASPSPLTVDSGPPMSPPLHSPLEQIELKSPPAVAPKPKKLPANIILKSLKSSVAGPDGNLVSSAPACSDRVLMDPQRVHLEALRKLGLLKSSDADHAPSLSPKLSPQTRKSWAAPSSPGSPAASRKPPSTPPHTRVNSPPPVFIPAPPVIPAAVTAASGVLPAPAAFCDPSIDTELSDGKTPPFTPPQTPPALVKLLTPPKVKSVKQESHEAKQGINREQDLSQLRNSRPRPASLGSGTEFSSAQAGLVTSKHLESRRSLFTSTPFQHSSDSQTLPRSQGISVLICPRAENEEKRREALKKLGLLRD
ncbi:specifically androgen-regulated gene protein [Aulostomus maculatus]